MGLIYSLLQEKERFVPSLMRCSLVSMSHGQSVLCKWGDGDEITHKRNIIYTRDAVILERAGSYIIETLVFVLMQERCLYARNKVTTGAYYRAL